MNRRQLLTTALAAVLGSRVPARAATAAEGAGTNLITREAGARVQAFSSEYGAGWVADNLVPAREQLGDDGRPLHELIWSSGASVPFPHWVLIDLGQRRWLTSFVFNNALSEEADHPGISARQLELWTGDDAGALKKLLGFQLERNKDGQSVAIEPVQARFLKLVVTTNWGHPWYTELGAALAFDDGRRPGDLATRLKAEGRADLHGLYFDFGSAVLRPESAPVLQQVLAVHRSQPGRTLVLEGHTDNVGAAAANLDLSQRRAAAVRAELLRLGVSAEVLQAVGFGPARPVASNATDAGRARNRRVTLVLGAA
jgi:outer membrane protein OmpA-like peptidoglycan-associated protein